jgi:CII-binding regulator of phage lambda lysogenization HflD
MIMSAIQGNANAISQLASTVNCDVNAVQTALNSIQNSICQLGNTVGLSGQQIINAIQSGDASLASKLAECCCENRLLTTQ